ncbi:MAG: SNF2-related protein, partial [bacterium]
LGMMARMVSLANYQHSENILSFILPHLQDALLFRGDGDYYGNPFTNPILQVDATPRPLQISMVDENDCTYLGATLPDDDENISLTSEETRIINVNPLWVLTDDRLLRVEGDAALLKGLLESREIVIPQAEKKNFISRYLPKLLDFAEVSGDAIGEREELDIAPVCRVYLREEDSTITADLAFAYASYEVSLETSWPKTALQYDDIRGTLINITRHCAEEESAWRAMNSYGLKRDGDRFVLKTKVAPVDFLLRHVTQLQAAGYEVFGEDELKGARVNRSVPKVRMTVSSGIDWFDVLTVVSYGEQDVAMSEIRKAIKKRQGYVKLPDGTLGMLPDEIIARYRQLFAMGIETETGVRMSKTQATLLELSLQDTDAEVDAEYTRRIEQLRNFSQIAPRPLSPHFCGELRHYQKTGFDWLHFLHDYGFGGCLADDMGIGKTVQALVFLQSLYESGHATSASLIVMPRSLLENWAREAARFTPDLKVIIHADGDRSDDHASFDGYQLVLTTYGVMLRDLSMFKKYPFHYLVLDEAQAIKNPASQSARAARLLTGEHRLALTGTPVENSTEELWSLFAFLNPGQLGSQEAFREQFANPIQRNQDEAAAKALRTLVHPFILRRTKEQVAPELPPRTERLIYCEMTPSQRKLYLKTRDRYRDELMGLIDNGGMQQARFKVLEGLLRLRQLANDPRLVDKTYTGTSSKFEAILDAMEVLREEGHKALIFSQFTSMLSLLRASMEERDWPYLYLDGKTKNRQDLVDNFQENEEIPFFLISLKAGGTGLNLTAADYVIHIDPWWNPAVERQATDRTHRIGQERPVMVYKFIAEESVEEKILLLQEKKQALVDQLISTEGSLMKSLTRDDVAALFT